jgi:hypothetical protein
VEQQQGGAANSWKIIYDQETETGLVRLNDLTPGAYQWKVSSVDEKSGTSKSSPSWRFQIDQIPKLEWALKESPINFAFTSPTPTLKAAWQPLEKPPASYRYKISGDQQKLETQNWSTTKQNLFDVSLPAEGRDEAVVEAVNAKGQVIAQSEVKVFTVKRQPLLPAPMWGANTPEILKSDGKGNITFSWEQVTGAQRYLMVIESHEGKVVEQKEIQRNTASIKRLKPGEYRVQVQTIDEFKRPGPGSEKRKIEVPAVSDIRAPKIKAMKVK